jgi:8-oxo-dGTP pyrophosphatase MutT (NUDIX family)
LSFLDRVRACAVFTPEAYRPFRVDGVDVGLVAHDFAEALAPSTDVFAVSDAAVTLAPSLPTDAPTRTGAVAAVLRPLAEAGMLRGWRDEHYDVAAAPGAPVLFAIERAAVPKFGIIAAGIHVNGFVRTADGGIKMWIGRRALNKANSPGKLDQLVGGGRPAAASVRETLLKESEEEADLPAPIAGAAMPVGAVTYRTERSEGLRRDVLYVFDLELPEDVVPRNTDGEISEFYLWPLERVIETVRDSDEFKFNCALIVIDFLIRHGYIDADEPDYLALVHGLRSLALPDGGLAR